MEVLHLEGSGSTQFLRLPTVFGGMPKQLIIGALIIRIGFLGAEYW